MRFFRQSVGICQALKEITLKNPAIMWHKAATICQPSPRRAPRHVPETGSEFVMPPNLPPNRNCTPRHEIITAIWSGAVS